MYSGTDWNGLYTSRNRVLASIHLRDSASLLETTPQCEIGHKQTDAKGKQVDSRISEAAWGAFETYKAERKCLSS